MIYAISPVITSSFPTTLIFVKIERSPNRNLIFPQFPRLPLYKEILQILAKLQKKPQIAQILQNISYLCIQNQSIGHNDEKSITNNGHYLFGGRTGTKCACL